MADGQQRAGVRLEVAPWQALADTPIAACLGGLAPRQRVRLRARLIDDHGRRWESSAEFAAGPGDEVDPAEAPLSGSYAVADATGLLWSMRLDPAADPGPLGKTGLTPTTVQFAAEVDGRTVAETSIERLHVAPGVRRRPVRERGLVSTLFTPPGRARTPR